MKNIFKKGRGIRVKSFSPKLKAAVLMVFAMAAVWAVLPAKGAYANFACDTGTVNDTCTINSAKTMGTGGETITGSGNLVINAALNASSSIDISYFNFGGNITINSGGSITTNFQATSTDFTINSGGSINVNGKGCAGGGVAISGGGGGSSCAGGGTGGGRNGSNGGSGGGGGGHGGNGGNGGSTSNTTGVSYDSATQPVLLGSGGGGSKYNGGNGGGVVKIVISGAVTINGTITANGNNAANYSAGGGSGGSIWIQAGTLSGNATTTANGGNGIGASGYGNGGGGAGGRVAIYYGTSTYNGAITANAGTVGTGGTNGSSGQAGKISISAVSTITAICSVAGNGCTASGQSASPQQAFNIDSIAGTATSTLGTYSTSTQKVEISIKDTDVSVDKWWNGSSFASTTEYWFQPTGITNWSYDTSAIVWPLGHTYQIRSRAYNAYGIVESSPQTLSFIAVNSPPTVSNVTASANATTTVSVSYDVSDPELGAGNLSWIELFYDSGTTLTGSLAQGSMANISLTGDASFLPLSNGTTTIDEEVIAYATRSGNTLSGITRGANNTTDTGHSAGAKVWVRAVSATGNVGSSIPTGTGKTITWNTKTDIDGFYSGTEQIRVVAHDGATQSMIGWATSSAFILDTDAPDLIASTLLINGTSTSPMIATGTSTIALGLQSITGNASNETIYVQFASGTSPTVWYGANSTSSLASADNWGSGFSMASSTDGSIIWPWTMSSTTEVINVRIKDSYGNQQAATDSITAQNTAAPGVTASTLNINGSALTVNIATSTAPTVSLSLQGITGDASSETIYVQFSRDGSTWYGANYNGALASAGNWGGGFTVASSSEPTWSWTVQNRLETIRMRVKDGFDNLQATIETNDVNWNLAPEFQQTISALQIATTTDSNWGKVQVDFSIRDTDTDLGANTANYVTPTFEYNAGSGWNAIASSSLSYAAAPPSGGYSTYSNATTTKVLISSYLGYTAYWTPPAELYSASAQVRLTINDNEIIFNTASSTTSGFLLSSTKPVVSFNSLKINDSSGAVNATSSTATLTLQNITGDTSSETVYVQFATGTSPTVWYGADSGGGAVSTSMPNSLGSGMTIATATSTNTSWVWILGGRTEKINVRVRDAYNNIADIIASSTASWNNQPEFQSQITASQITNNADANWGKVKVDYIARDQDTALNTSSTMQGYAQISFQYSTGTSWTSIPRTYLTGDIGSLVDANTGRISILASYPAASSTTYWNTVGQLGNYTGGAQVRVTIDDTEAIFNSASSTSATISNLDAERPSFSSFTAGSASANNIQFTDADGDGVADNRNVTLRLNNLVESSSSTQGVYVLFSNDGTNYGTSTDSNGAVSAVATSSISNWENISGGALASYSKTNWYLVSGGSRSKTVYALVKDAYGNDISSAASATVTWNKRPQFSASTITDSDNSSVLSASSTSGVMIRQCDIYDTDSNCGAGKIKIIYAPRDPDANESGLATKGQLSTTFDYSTNGGVNWTAISALIATTTVATSSADVAGGYNPVYSTTTTYWDASALGSQNNLRVRVTANDNEAGANTASSTSNIITYDKTNPSGSNITFDAGVAGASESASVTIPLLTDANATQYLLADDSATHSSASTTPWTTISATTTIPWTFDSDIEAKSLKFQYRDVYGNTTSTSTVSTIAPIDPTTFLIQDVSKLDNTNWTNSQWRMYVGWGVSTSTNFLQYQLEYATTTSASVSVCSSSLGDFQLLPSTPITNSATSYYVHDGLHGPSSSTAGDAWCYKYRLGVKSQGGIYDQNVSVRSVSYSNDARGAVMGRPNGIQDQGEGGGGSVVSATASQVTNVVPAQGADGNVTVNYKLTDTSLSSKVSPSYEGYVFYNIGTYLMASTTNTLVLSDTSKLPLTNGYIQINQEVIGYAVNSTSTNTLSGVTRGTWPTFISTGRATRINATMASSTSVWIAATSTGANVGNSSISTGQDGTLSWNPRSDSILNGNYLSGVGIRVLVHDGQTVSSGPVSSQSDRSVDSTLAILDLKAPVLGASSLLINSSASSVENASSTAALSLTGVSGDTSSETIYIQFATSSNWFGAKANGTISATSSDWGDAMSIGGNLGPWTWPLSGRSETVSVRVKDAYGNISNTDTNSIIKNAVPEFSGSVSDSDAASYATTTNNNIVIRQCNIYDTDPLCATGKVKVKFLVRDPDTAQGVVTPGYIHADFAFSMNGGAYATSSVATYSATGTNALALDAQAGTSAVASDGATYTTVTAYYDPGIASSASLTARISVTDNEAGTTPVAATSNSISYDKTAPSGSLTFDAGIAGSSTTAVITIPVPTDANAVQYMFSATTTSGTASTTIWTTLASPASVLWGFDSAEGVKSVSYSFRDIYGNQSATGTASSLAPILGGSFTVDDISTGSNKRTYLSWTAATSSDFAMYRLEYATSSDGNAYTSYAELVTLSSASTNYYTHAGLNSSVWYRYRLSVKNSAGNYSVKTLKNSNPYITAKPDGILNGDEASADDRTEPTVTNVSAPTILATTATIRFDITDNASSQMSTVVYYAASADYNSAASSTRSRYAYKFGPPGYVSTGTAGSSTTTSVTISGLTKNTLYKYAVEVCDITGNCKFKEQSDGAPYELTTANGPAIVSGSIVPANGATIATYDIAAITWATDIGADSQVFYSASTSAGALVNPTTAGSDTQISSPDGNNQYPHSASISGLSANSTYYYKVRSTDRNSASASYLQYDESPVRSFTTASQPVPTMTAAPSCSVTESSITVNWTTDQDSTTEISVLSANVGGNYFNSTAGAQINQYPGTSLTADAAAWISWRSTADYGKNHSQTFTGLTESTTYYIQARSLNRSSGEASGLLSCKTTTKEVIVSRPAVQIQDVTPPIISAVAIEDITGTTAKINWKTDEMADTLVKYGATMSYGSIAGTENLASEHSAMLSGLKPETTYNFKITSADTRGNRAYAGDQSFTTLSLLESAQTTKDELEKLQKELKELKEKQESEAKKAQSLAEATKRFKAILKSVASDVSLQDLEDLTTDISDTITDITQEVTPPNIIGGVPAVEIEATTATIKWKTNKPSNSIIALAPQPDYDAQAKDPYTLQVGQAQEEVQEHAVTIPDLRPSTLYHFQIRSKAKVGPEGRSRDFVFETKPELPVIIDYSFKKITENSIAVVWRTNTLTSSLVRYTPFSPAGDLLEKESKTQGNPAFVQTHEVEVSGLPSNIAYLIEISSKDVTGAEVSKVIGTVRTIIDIKAPVITKARAESTLFPGKVEKTQTIIYWETDEPSTSQIFWKEGMAKGDFANASRLDMEYTTSHVMVMTNFKPGAVYRFQVESTDPAGNKSRSTDYTVLTPKKGETVIDLIINNFQDIFGFLKKM